MNQADISVIKKSELVERLSAIRKAFDKQRKDKENAANKAVSITTLSMSLEYSRVSSSKAVEDLSKFFEANPNAQVYFANVDGAEGNAKV